MKKKYYLLIILIIVINFPFNLYPAKRSTSYKKILGQIQTQVNKQISKDYNIYLAGFGGSFPKGKIKTLNFTFESNLLLNVPNARNLYLEIVHKTLKIINTNPKFRPFLLNYPFNINNLKLGVIFVRKNGGFYPHPNVGIVSYINENIVYGFYDPEKKFFSIDKNIKEPYQEALEKVRKSQEGMTKQAA